MDAEFYGKSIGKTRLTERITNALKAEANDPKTKRRRSRLFHPYFSSLLGPTIIWRTFSRQAAALEYRESLGSDVHVFAYESISLTEGRRRYLVTAYEHFWHDYNAMDSDQRTLYEVIPENTPVKLYFDLEFVKETNPEANVDEMMAVFLLLLDQTVKLIPKNTVCF